MDDNMQLSKMRYRVCELVSKSNEGHLLSSLSALDTIFAIYSCVLRKSELSSDYPFKDKFVLSKGHAALGLYVALEELGFIEKQELDNFCQSGSNFGGHPDATKFNLALASTGSLGHGFPICVGLAYSTQLQKSNSRIFCLIGDGESMEGTLWESLNLVKSLGLSNITLMVDYNNSHTMSANTLQLSNTFESFGWNISQVNGHNIEEIVRVLNSHAESLHFVILNTKRGYGIPLIEGKAEWHHRTPTREDLALIKNEIFN
jgi:transketolase